MRLFATVIFLVLVTGAKSAWALVVRTGDHETFTRVVIPLPERATYKIIQSDTQVRIELAGIGSTLDISSVFDRISRDRIQNISAAAGRVTLDLNCDCDVEDFLTSSRLLVVDVNDQDTDRVPPAQFIEGLAGALLAPVSSNVLDVFVSPSRITSPSPVLRQGGESIEVGTQQTPAAANQPISLAPFTGLSVLSDYQAAVGSTNLVARDVERLGEALRDNLSQAGDVGVLDSVSPSAPKAVSETQVGAPDLPDNIRIAPLGLETDRATPTPVVNCLPNDVLDVSSWTTSNTLAAALSDARLAMLDAAEHFKQDATNQLMKTYLRFGLPTEALAVGRQQNQDDIDAKLLSAIAEIMSGQPQSAASVFDGQIGCTTDASFWSLLSNPSEGTDRSADERVLMGAFQRLPREVQSVLISDFERALRVANMPATAQEVRLAYGTGEQVGAPTRVERPAADSTNVDIAAKTPEPKSNVSSVLASIEDAWMTKTTISPEQLQIMEASAFEHRGSPWAQELNYAVFRGFILNSRFEEAFELLVTSDLGRYETQATEDFSSLATERLPEFEQLKFSYLMKNRTSIEETAANGPDLFQMQERQSASETPTNPQDVTAVEPSTSVSRTPSDLIPPLPSLAASREILETSSALRSRISTQLTTGE